MATNKKQAQGGKSLNAHIHTNITINKPRKQVYARLRSFENMPRYVSYLGQVKVMDDTTSEWQAKTSKSGKKALVKIIDETPGQMIKAQAYIGADLKGECTITFTDAGDNATDITIDVYYHNPLGSLAGLFSGVVENRLKTPKREFKEALEADL